CEHNLEDISKVTDKKVVLVLEQIVPGCDACADPYVLLNGVTSDVDITYNFYNKDGSFQFDPDRLTIFNYCMDSDAWNLLPISVDKVYYTGNSAPSTNAKYPDGITARKTAKVKVDNVSEALIALDGGYPQIVGCSACDSGSYDQGLLFGLDADGVAFGASKDINYLKGGFAYAIDMDDDVDIYTFGYVMPDETALSGLGAKLTANVINVDLPASARGKSNLGWNLIADVADITLISTAGYVDYVITFEDGDFESWISGGTLEDFTTITNDYTGNDSAIGTLYTRGKGYFVHTNAKTAADR
ncbi:MAG: hypothetical protein KAR13_17145, partial [Desulfobulbaceae bacterium]|nr:hypothetical protein [Desulfobulbaceae bacterium]